MIKKCKLLLLTLVLLMTSCESNGVGGIVSSLNLFPVSKDKALGQKVKTQLENDSSKDIISREDAPEAYKMLDDIVETIKSSGKLKYKDDFAWEVYIIREDVLNAFCAPGGYIYVYTGLMKYLDTVDDLAGVMGHEMAHADERHSTSQMSRTFGVELLTAIVLGKNSNKLAELATGLFTLKYGRNDEAESDERSVEYLCGTKYKSDGAASFFQKLTESGQSQSKVDEFLSTHPNPSSRVENIQSKAVRDNCNTTPKLEVDYKTIVDKL